MIIIGGSRSFILATNGCQYEQAGTALTPNMSTAFRPACLYFMLGAVLYSEL
jgi:hypothetical protein